MGLLELEVTADEIEVLPMLNLLPPNTQDQVDANITADSPDAKIRVYNDFDNDGVIDLIDFDDDNDGVEDRMSVRMIYRIRGGEPTLLLW